MRQVHLSEPGQSSRRDFLSRSAGLAAIAASAGFAGPSTPAAGIARARTTPQETDDASRIRISSVDAYPVYINSRSEDLLDPPVFSGDDDPRRWRYGGPFEQLPSAIIAVVKTNTGVTGFGMGAGGSAAVEIIDGHLQHLLVGANPLNVEQLWDQMYSSALLYGRRGVFAMALSAVDNALWDIAGKHAGKPVHALLGGKPDDRVPVYQTGGDIAAGKSQGIRHFKRILPIGPHSTKADTDRGIADVLAAREAMGPEGNLMTDCVSRNGTVDWAVGIAERLRPANLYFMEELLSPDNVFGYAELVQRIGGGGPGWTKVACGEHEYTEVRLRGAGARRVRRNLAAGHHLVRRSHRCTTHRGAGRSGRSRTRAPPRRQPVGTADLADRSELHDGRELRHRLRHPRCDAGAVRRWPLPGAHRTGFRHRAHRGDGARPPPRAVK